MKTFVAVLDILGFGSLDIHSDPYKMLEATQGPLSLDGLLRLSPVGTEFYDWKIQGLLALDTFYLYTCDGSSLSFQRLVRTVGTLLTNYFFMDELPLRGAVTFGECLISESKQINQGLTFGPIVSGRAMIEAHNIEKSQCWAGCVVASSAIEQYKKVRVNDDPTFDNFPGLVQYNVPFKCGARNETVVNWFGDSKFFKDGTPACTEEEIRRRFSSRGRSIEAVDVRIKVDNTIAFFNSCGT